MRPCAQSHFIIFCFKRVRMYCVGPEAPRSIDATRRGGQEARFKRAQFQVSKVWSLKYSPAANIYFFMPNPSNCVPLRGMLLLRLCGKDKKDNEVFLFFSLRIFHAIIRQIKRYKGWFYILSFFFFFVFHYRSDFIFLAIISYYY